MSNKTNLIKLCGLTLERFELCAYRLRFRKSFLKELYKVRKKHGIIYLKDRPLPLETSHDVFQYTFANNCI